MNVAVRQPTDATVPTAQPGRTGAIVRYEMYDGMAAAEPVWRRLEGADPWSTPYQRFDLLSAWHRHAGARDGVAPCILVGLDRTGEPAVLWPLGLKRFGPVGVAEFLGSTHCNFNLPLCRRDVATAMSDTDLGDMLARFSAHGVDVLRLHRQPESWGGIANPMMRLAHQPCADQALRLTLHGPAEAALANALSASMHSKLRRKEKPLKRLAGYRYLRAREAADVDRLLDRFFPLKATHMAANGIPDVFSDTGVQAFVREACHTGLAAGRPPFELHALETDNELLALYGAVNGGKRSSLVFNTYTQSDRARYSPGLILIMHIVGAIADRGFTSFDLGVGTESYKQFFCREPEPLFDSYLPLTPLGRLAAPTLRAVGAARRTVKTTPALWSAVRFARSLRAARR